MHAWHNAFDILVDFFEDAHPDAGHDAHVDDRVGRIGELNPNSRHGRFDRSHAERKHIHRTAPHTAAEEVFQRAAHLKGVDPIVRGAGTIFGEGTDKRTIFHAGDIAWI